MIYIKSPSEIQKMIEAGKILGECFDFIRPYIVPGVSTGYLDDLVEKFLRKHNCIPSFKMVDDYPASICASVNDMLIHGIPSYEVILKEGDILSIDMGNIYHGYNGDAARTFAVGKVSEEAQRLIKCTKECFYAAMDKARVGNHLNDISKEISRVAASYGYSPVKEFGGHGIGKEMHEDPFIWNYDRKNGVQGVALRKGMCLAIEPMILAGSSEIYQLNDGWGIVSADGKLTCHYENTIYIDDDGPHITTIDEDVKGYLSNVER